MTHQSRRHALRAAARTAYRNGWMPLPVPARSKNPNRKGWQDERLTDEEIDAHFASDELNLGVLLGEPSNGLTDVDLDCPEAVAVAAVLLPPTGAVFGRPARPSSHWLYCVAGELTTRKHQDPLAGGERAMLVELRFTGTQTLFPPSIHPSGELIAWDRDDLPAQVAAAELRQAVDSVAAATLLARHWPTGSRHDAALALAGGLLRAGWATDEIEQFLTAIALAAGDDDLRDRLKAILSSVDAIRAGNPTTGWPRLVRLIDDRIVSRVREWLGIHGRSGAASNSSYEEFTSTSAETPEQAARAIPVPPFPLEVFPPRFRQYIERGAASVGCPPDLVAVPFLGYAAAAIGKTRVIRIKRGWVQRPILWMGVVAVSGDGKSPADSYARAALDELQARADERYQEQLERYKLALAQWKDSDRKPRGEEPAPPLYEHWYSTDATVESLAPMLRHNTGLALACDELVAWARGCNQFKKGGNDRQKYLEIWNGRPLKVDRKTQGVIFVKEPVLCIVGGIQPERLREMTNEASVHDGLLPRYLWAYPDVPLSEWSWEESEVDDLPWMIDLFARLRKSVNPLGPLVLRPDPEAKALWKQWYDALKQRKADLPPLAREVASKLPAQLARLWLVLEALWNSEGTSSVASAARLADAIALVDYFGAHHRRVMVHFGTTAPEIETGLTGKVRSILAQVGPNTDGWLSRTELWNRLNRNGTAEALDAALAQLSVAGLIECREVATGTKTRTEWRLIRTNSSYEVDEEFDDWEDVEPADTPRKGNTSNNSYEEFTQERAVRVCYACKRTRFYPDGVCTTCHPRDWIKVTGGAS